MIIPKEVRISFVYDEKDVPTAPIAVVSFKPREKHYGMCTDWESLGYEFKKSLIRLLRTHVERVEKVKNAEAYAMAREIEIAMLGEELDYHAHPHKAYRADCSAEYVDGKACRFESPAPTTEPPVQESV